MLVSAGRTVLLEEGLTLGMERVTFKRVFDGWSGRRVPG